VYKLKTLNCEHNQLTILSSLVSNNGLQLLCTYNPLVYKSTKLKYIYEFNKSSDVLILRLKKNVFFYK
jgi:Leucine-rich repeat (LRR) protein